MMQACSFHKFHHPNVIGINWHEKMLNGKLCIKTDTYDR